jgi:cytochrome oxidase Cu insertion factor (SCO1/SenC/PrrC family)
MRIAVVLGALVAALAIPAAVLLARGGEEADFRDTPERIDQFFARYRATGTMRYLDGTVAELRPVWQGFQVASSLDSGNSNLHSAPVRVYDGDGRWRSTLHAGVDLTPVDLAHDLREAIRVT